MLPETSKGEGVIKKLPSILLATLLCTLQYATSPAFAEFYRWVDAEGTVNISDMPPPKDQIVKPPDSRPGERKLKASKSSQKTETASSADNPQPPRRQSLAPDAACIQELSIFDKSFKNDESLKRCTETVTIKFKGKYSPECLRQIESKRSDISVACRQEMQVVGQAMISELQQCTQMEARLNSSISANCREQIERYKKSMAVCAEVSQKIAGICGANLHCIEEHKAEREAACNGLK